MVIFHCFSLPEGTTWPHLAYVSWDVLSGKIGVQSPWVLINAHIDQIRNEIPPSPEEPPYGGVTPPSKRCWIFDSWSKKGEQVKYQILEKIWENYTDLYFCAGWYYTRRHFAHVCWEHRVPNVTTSSPKPWNLETSWDCCSTQTFTLKVEIEPSDISFSSLANSVYDPLQQMCCNISIEIRIHEISNDIPTPSVEEP